MELRIRQQSVARYNASPKGLAAKARYRATPQGHTKDLAASTRRREANPERHHAEFRSWYEQLPPITRLLRTARKSAAKRGLKFEIEDADLLPFPTHCPVLGIKLRYECGPRIGPRAAMRRDLASIDRRNNSLGYVRGNVFIVSWRANQLKSDATSQEISALAKWMGDNNGN